MGARRGAVVAGLLVAAPVLLAAPPADAIGLDDPRCARARIIDLDDVVAQRSLRGLARAFPRRATVKVLAFDGLDGAQNVGQALRSAAEACGDWGYAPGDRRSLFVLGIDAEAGEIGDLFEGRLINRFEATRPAALAAADPFLAGGDATGALDAALSVYAASVQPGVEPVPPADQDPASPSAEPAGGAEDQTSEQGAEQGAEQGEQAEQGGGASSLALWTLLAVGLLALALAGAVARRRLADGRRRGRIDELAATAAVVSGQVDRVVGAAQQTSAAAARLPESDDEVLAPARAAAAAAAEQVDALLLSRRQIETEHAALLPAGGGAVGKLPDLDAQEPDDERIAAAELAYADLRSRAAATAERVAAADAALAQTAALIAALPDRQAGATDGARELSDVLDELESAGYRTAEYAHVPAALEQRLAEVQRLVDEGRPGDASGLLDAVQADLEETAQRLERLDEERAGIGQDIERVGQRTTRLDEELSSAFAALAALEQRLSPASTEGLRARLEAGAHDRAAIPRLLRTAGDEASADRQRLISAREQLEEASARCASAEAAVAEVQERLAQLQQVAAELPLSADRTEARAQRLAERMADDPDAVTGDASDPAALASLARSLGAEARGDRPDLLDIGVRLDALRQEVAVAERGLDAALTAYAGRQLALAAASATVEQAVAALETAAADATSDIEEAAGLLQEAVDQLTRAEAEADHEAAARMASSAQETARRAAAHL